MAIYIDELIKEKERRETEEKVVAQAAEERKKQAELAYKKTCDQNIELLSQIPELAKKIGKPMIQMDIYCGRRLTGWAIKKINVWYIGSGYWGKYGDWERGFREKVKNELGFSKEKKYRTDLQIPPGFAEKQSVYMDENGNCYISIRAYHGSKRLGSFDALYPINKADIIHFLELSEDNVKEMLLQK